LRRRPSPTQRDAPRRPRRGRWQQRLSAALGPVLGGVLTDTVGGRFIFWSTHLSGLVAFAMSYRYLRNRVVPRGQGRPHRTDSGRADTRHSHRRMVEGRTRSVPAGPRPGAATMASGRPSSGRTPSHPPHGSRAVLRNGRIGGCAAGDLRDDVRTMGCCSSTAWDSTVARRERVGHGGGILPMPLV